jgi:hypothetical protein
MRLVAYYCLAPLQLTVSHSGRREPESQRKKTDAGKFYQNSESLWWRIFVSGAEKWAMQADLSRLANDEIVSYFSISDDWWPLLTIYLWFAGVYRTKWLLPFWLDQAKTHRIQHPWPAELTKRDPHIFDDIGQEILIAIFETWINRLEWVIENAGEYFHQ